MRNRRSIDRCLYKNDVTMITPRVFKFPHIVLFQNGSEMLKTVSNVSKVYDEVEKEQARLYNPFIITLAKTPVQLVYPYYYRGVSSPQRLGDGREERELGEQLSPWKFFRLLD